MQKFWTNRSEQLKGYIIQSRRKVGSPIVTSELILLIGLSSLLQIVKGQSNPVVELRHLAVSHFSMSLTFDHSPSDRETQLSSFERSSVAVHYRAKRTFNRVLKLSEKNTHANLHREIPKSLKATGIPAKA